MSNILIGYPQARMCVWAKQEECYFWSPVVAQRICACQHKLIHVAAWTRGMLGFNFGWGMCLTLILFFLLFFYSLCLSKLCFPSFITNLTMCVGGCGELQRSIWRSSSVSWKCKLYWTVLGYVSLELNYFRNVIKRVLPSDVDSQLTMKTYTDLRQLRETGQNIFVCTSHSCTDFTSSLHLIARFKTQKCLFATRVTGKGDKPGRYSQYLSPTCGLCWFPTMIVFIVLTRAETTTWSISWWTKN